jgi:hypothetical protein
MKKILAFGTFVIRAFNVNASSYHLNEQNIESAFDQSLNLTTSLGVMDMSTIITEFSLSEAAEEGSKQQTAAIVGVISLITGIGILIPIHRFILGTGDNGAIIFLVYCGAGILGGLSWWLTLVDVIFMFTDDTKSAYIDSGKILMWSDKL